MINRMKYTDAELQKLLRSMVILIDSREKKNQHITGYFDSHNIEYRIMALPSGDYSWMLPKNEELGIINDMFGYNDIIIEKKNSLEELSGNFSAKRDQFNSEWSRCYAKRRYLVIENASYEDLVEGHYDTNYNSKSFLGSLHSFNAKYGMEVMFIKDPKYTPVYILATCQYFLRYLLK